MKRPACAPAHGQIRNKNQFLNVRSLDTFGRMDRFVKVANLILHLTNDPFFEANVFLCLLVTNFPFNELK